ncbi:MAG: cation diffusion facilitator family transporter [Muribaculaceae bacterium]|nr:cation diffusion facilitator family transporter [Muribaculaceae bacterium]
MEDHHNNLHHHHAHNFSRVNKVLIWGIVLNTIYVIAEGSIGIFSNSMGLVSDAGHNLSDVFSLLLTLVGVKLSLAAANRRFTYGYQKATILISLLNAIIILVAVGIIIVESINKFSHPEHIDGAVVSWTAGIGIIINGVTAWLLMKDQRKDLNIRGAFLHMAADTLVSVGVVIAGLIITFTGWTMIDPIISLIIAMLIMISTWSMLKETLYLAIDAVPDGIDINSLMMQISSINHVISIHHIHVWALSTTVNAMTLHVVIDALENEDHVKKEIHKIALNNSISHPTVEFETTPCSNCGSFQH